MNLEFTKNGDLYVAEFTAEADFNIHIEKDAGFVTLYQTSVAGGKYEVVRSLNRNYLDPVIDAAHKVLVAPLYIRLVSTTMPSVAVVTFRDNGNGGTPSPQWTGHADAEGLRAIGWTDEDIAYYQEHGVNWNEEDDQYHLVSEDNKALFGVVNATNIQEYRERIVYLPKIDTSNVVDMTGMFAGCNSLTAIPLLDTSNVEYMNGMFEDCYPLTAIPLLDTSNVVDMTGMFNCCYSLTAIPLLDTSNVELMAFMFNGCYSLTAIPLLDTSNGKQMDGMFSYCNSLTAIPLLDISNVEQMTGMFAGCYSLTAIPLLDTSNGKHMNGMFAGCYSLTSIPLLDISNVAYSEDVGDIFYDCIFLSDAQLKGVSVNLALSWSEFIKKDSLLYIIENEEATSGITIELSNYTYTRLANDADVVAALTSHPNITLASL